MSRILSFMLLAASALIFTACNGGGGGGGGDAGPDQGPDFGEGVVPPPWIDNAEFSPDGSPKCDLERWCDQPLFYFSEETQYYERVPPGTVSAQEYPYVDCFFESTTIALDERSYDFTEVLPYQWSTAPRDVAGDPVRWRLRPPQQAPADPPAWLLDCDLEGWATFTCILGECIEYNRDGTLAE